MKASSKDLTKTNEADHELYDILAKIQHDSTKTKDSLENELEKIERQLKAMIKKQLGKLEALEKDIAESKCKWW